MDVIDWKSTSIRPTAFRSNCATGVGWATADSSRPRTSETAKNHVGLDVGDTGGCAHAAEAKAEQLYAGAAAIPRGGVRRTASPDRVKSGNARGPTVTSQASLA